MIVNVDTATCYHETMDLEKAKKIADEIATCVTPACSRVTIAGSIRREKPQVKDIELVMIVNDYDVLYRRLRSFGRFIKPGVPSVIDWPPKAGAKYVRMLLDEGIKLDAFIGHHDNWGALLCMRTGSASGPDGNTFNGFVPRMFKQWKKVSGGGRMLGCMPTMPDGLQLATPEELDFFELCGVEWIDPKDRIDAKAVKVKSF